PCRRSRLLAPLPFVHLSLRPPPSPTLFPYTTLFRSVSPPGHAGAFGRSRPGHRTDLCLVLGARPRAYAACRRSGNGRAHLAGPRSEEHTSELQSRENLVCRLLLEKKNTNSIRDTHTE